MHLSARTVVGLSGLASISSAFPVGSNSASALPAGSNLNATTITNTTDASAPALHEAITNVTEDINITTTTTNNTEDPAVVFSNDTYSYNPETFYLWLEDPPKEEEIDRRLTRAERQPSSHLVSSKRGDPPLPPRDRTLADHMENHGEGLPECYKKCMRSEDGKASMHMGKDTLGQICGWKWTQFAWWSEHHIYWCVNGKNGCPNKQAHRDAYKWLKATCGDKPN